MSKCDSCVHKDYCPLGPKDNVKECEKYKSEDA